MAAFDMFDLAQANAPSTEARVECLPAIAQEKGIPDMTSAWQITTRPGLHLNSFWSSSRKTMPAGQYIHLLLRPFAKNTHQLNSRHAVRVVCHRMVQRMSGATNGPPLKIDPKDNYARRASHRLSRAFQTAQFSSTVEHHLPRGRIPRARHISLQILLW